jgi:3-oxoadipate enol-lactonase
LPGRSCAPSPASSATRRLTSTRTESGVARVNGTELHYDVAGAGPPVVLLHAALGGRSLWDAQWESLIQRHQVVRYDARGYGDSPLPGGPFSYVDDLWAFLDHLEIEAAALVGNSLGGKTALDAALIHAERVSALVLVDSALGGHETSELDAYNEEEDALLDAGRVDEAVELNLRVWLGSDVDPVARKHVQEEQRRAFETILAAYERDPPPGPVAWLDDPPTAERLHEIGQPTLVVVGGRDVADFQVLADRLAAEIPGARKTVIPGAAHLPGVERPEELNRIVLTFLAEVLG